LIKRKSEGVGAKATQKREVDIPLDIVKFDKDHYLLEFDKKKKKFWSENLKEWFFNL
jgi:hypothetical protein